MIFSAPGCDAISLLKFGSAFVKSMSAMGFLSVSSTLHRTRLHLPRVVFISLETTTLSGEPEFLQHRPDELDGEVR
jgi:hypothetical protein